jgi:hypothetical protein
MKGINQNQSVPGCASSARTINLHYNRSSENLPQHDAERHHDIDDAVRSKPSSTTAISVLRITQYHFIACRVLSPCCTNSVARILTKSVLDPFVSLPIIMQAPPPPPPRTNQAEAEAIIPMEAVSSNDDANMNRTVIISRKAAKRSLPWDQAAGELDLVSQDEEIPSARKKRRLEEPLPTATDEAARKTASPDVSVALPPSDDDDGIDDANAGPSTDTQPNVRETRANRRWTLDIRRRCKADLCYCEYLQKEVRQGLQD